MRELLKHARHLRNMRDDLMSAGDLMRLETAECDARRALEAAGAGEALERAGETLYRCLMDVTPTTSWSGLRENVEILVVALAVAMGFRTYFFQPFKIPTGSMEPTLCGIQTSEAPDPMLWDRLPLKIVKWAVTGQWYMEVTARNSGELSKAARAGASGDDHNRIHRIVYVGQRPHKLPRGAEPQIEEGAFVRKGDRLWSGMRTSGDHVFVNKIAWNFRPPRRAEVVVFRTDGIPIIPPVEDGTHYIKRLIGLPNEKVSIANGSITINGTPIPDPRRLAIRRLTEKSFPHYRGTGLNRNAAGLAGSHINQDYDIVALNTQEYFTLGDNAASSLDGRYWRHVPEDNLVGPAAAVYWPLSPRWGFIR